MIPLIIRSCEILVWDTEYIPDHPVRNTYNMLLELGGNG